MNETKTRVEVRTEDGETLGQVTVSVARPASNGVTGVRFNFLYSENKKRSPDKQPSLVATWRSVADWVKKELKPKRLFLSGRSMGGRMASYLVADG